MSVMTEREKRLGLNLPVAVTGTDAAGAPFEESTRSVNVSGGGICFESRRKLLVGQQIRLRIELPPPLRRHFGGRSAYRARAVVCRVEQFEGEPGARVGARLLSEA